ncbi:hypothetical protein [Burkholderia sp. MSMB617WGS]|uniref:hypothetical protein n=1 Tax=Burkholderia sp. MSMB617WGS TaxID=1637831 RepID=UPI001F2EAA65|nr:hypothetical protein [Burkholderia sp. MSMB617WGS]
MRGERVDARPERRAREERRIGPARKRDERRAGRPGDRFGQAGAGRGRALGGREQVGAHAVHERSGRKTERGGRLLEERHVAVGGVQACDERHRGKGRDGRDGKGGCRIVPSSLHPQQ